jgi:hypothetical protein
MCREPMIVASFADPPPTAVRSADGLKGRGDKT